MTINLTVYIMRARWYSLVDGAVCADGLYTSVLRSSRMVRSERFCMRSSVVWSIDANVG
ncbi:MAG: hypothetical protein IJ668_08695 [Selenomonadaceae bacterium]|nr:hypothetical protein [Selenomonadaceae bacterium]